MRFVFVVAALLLVLVAFAACKDEIVPPSVPQAQSNGVSSQVGDRVPERSSTRWSRMTDSELSAAIEGRNEEAIIALKTPGTARGIYKGSVLVDANTFDRGLDSLQALGVAILDQAGSAPAILARLSSEIVPTIRDLPFIDYIEPNVEVEFPSSTRPGFLQPPMMSLGVQQVSWHIERVRAPYAWGLGTGSGVDVLVIDSGLDDSHIELAPDSVHGCDETSGVDVLGHGTFVAGVISAIDNSVGVIGVAHGANLWSAKVGNSAWWVRCGIELGRDNDLFVMNLSIQITDSMDVISDEVEAAWDEGHILIAAAGNTYGGVVKFPASHEDVIAVTATNTSDSDAGIGAHGSAVEIAAPGDSIFSTGWPNAAYFDYESDNVFVDTVAATSWASPHVAGAAAILKSYNGSWTNQQIRTKLQDAAVDLGTPGRDDVYGFGLLDIAGALGIQPVTASISGPTVIEPEDENCTWTAVAGGGVTPYSYKWYYDGQLIGTQSSWTGGVQNGDVDDEFRLTLIVTDFGDETATDSTFVTTSESAFPCPGF